MKKIIYIITALLLMVANFEVLAEKVVYIHSDVLGSPVAETDEGGNLTWTEHYSPFGEKIDDQDEAKENSVGYTGHQFDGDTGLSYMQARYYDPVIGRFYSNDPIGFRDVHSFNRYAYGNNNPYRFTDPTGMSSEDIDEPKTQGNTEKAIEMISDFFSSSQETADTVQTEISEVAEEITPSRETAHTVGTITAVGLTVASVTTPCTLACANAALAINSAQAADHLSQGKPIDAALTMLPAGAGKLTTAAFKGTQQVSKAEAGAIVDATISAVQIINK